MADTNTKKLLSILLLAAVVRLLVIFFVFADYRPTDDAAQWHEAALNFLDGRGLFITDNFLDSRGLMITQHLKAYRTPVPSLYFAAIYSIFGVSVRAVQVANVILGVLTVWLAYDLVKRSFGVISARWSALFVSVYPMLLIYTGQLLSETPTVMLIILALWLVWLLRDGPAIWLISVGVVLGLAVLTRQTVLPIAVLIALWTIIASAVNGLLRRILPSLIILGSLVLTIAPWTARNYILIGKFIPLTSEGGKALWIANNPLADGSAVDGYTVKFLQIPQVATLPEGEKGSAYQKLAIEFIRENPLRFAHLSLRRLPYFWHLGYHGQGRNELFFLMGYLPMLALAVIGIWVGWRSNLDATLLLLIVPVSLTAVHMVFPPEGRYRLPAELIMCMLAGIGTYSSLGKLLDSKIAARST